MEFIARVKTDMPDKFGVPRQSGLIKSLEGEIVFEPEYRVREALNGIEEFSHLWIIWQFSENVGKKWSPTVRPPRLGGDKRKGVFATRSPFRPNPIGISCVKLEAVTDTPDRGRVLKISGVDMANNTPVYDIKPYIPYTDCVTDASSGFAADATFHTLNVDFDSDLLSKIPPQKQQGILGILSSDPRPAYQHSSERIYGVRYMNFDVRFKVDGNNLKVVEVVEM